MNETAKELENEDWATIQFDEREDEERWARLIDEMDELEIRVAELEALHGELLMEDDLPTEKTNIYYEKPMMNFWRRSSRFNICSLSVITDNFPNKIMRLLRLLRLFHIILLWHN